MDNKFSLADYIVFGLSLTASLGVGLISVFRSRRSGKGETLEKFYFGNRKLNIFAVSLSLAATFLSAVSILGIPAEVYAQGASFALSCIPEALASITCIFILIPFFYRLQVTSVYEIFEIRFNRIVRRCASFIFLVNMILYMSVVLFAPSLALSQVSGLPLWVCVGSMGFICTVYTTFGLTAVVWADAFQMMVMLIGTVTVGVVVVITLPDSFSTIWQSNLETGRLSIDSSPDPTVRHSFWSLMIGFFFIQLPHGINQAAVQRYLSVKSERAAMKMVAINIPFLLIWKLMLVSIGLLVAAYYRGCDPLMTGRIQKPDQITMLMILDTLAFLPGSNGLFTAVIVCATLSTISSGINSIVVVINEDLLRPHLRNTERFNSIFFLRFSKILSFFTGCFIMILAYGAQFVGRGLAQFSLSISGMCGGPLLGLFLCGFLLPWCNSLGAGVGLVSGLCSVFWIALGAVLTQPARRNIPVDVSECPAEYFNTSDLTNTTTELFLPSMWLPLNNFSIPSPDCPDASNCLQSPGSSVDFSMNSIYSISYLYYSVIGLLVTITIASIVSLLSGRQRASNIPDRLKLYKVFSKGEDESSDVPIVNGFSHDHYNYSVVSAMDMGSLAQKGTSCSI